MCILFAGWSFSGNTNWVCLHQMERTTNVELDILLVVLPSSLTIALKIMGIIMARVSAG